MLKTINFNYGSGDFQINAVVVSCGDDLVVTIGGGTRLHTGAVAVAASHPSLKDPNRLTATASVIAFAGHKEDQITRAAAISLANALGTNVTVCAGLHIDDASPEDIERLVNNFNALIERVEAHFQLQGSHQTI